MSEILEKFIEFTTSDIKNFYITGQAGTGKTTALNELVSYCMSKNIEYTATAYTHKACRVLASKLPNGASVETLHSYLKKVPVDNDEAITRAALTSSKQITLPDFVRILFIDEYSMIGIRDKVSIDKLNCKVVYVGDCNQLLPVNDKAAIIPTGKYNVKLTKIYRQKENNGILDILTLINDSIEKKTILKLKFNANVLPCLNYKLVYKSVNSKILTYTNKNVQNMNAIMQGRTLPHRGDTLFCPNNNRSYIFLDYLKFDEVKHIISNQDIVENFSDKLKTLFSGENVRVYKLLTPSGMETIRVGIFGHGEYMRVLNEYASEGIKMNKQINTIKGNKTISSWSSSYSKNPLSTKRNRVWGKYFNLKDYVACLDFDHCITIHKSQGSTFENVIIDHRDLDRIRHLNYAMYKRLLYVAISRSANNVYIIQSE